MKITFYSNFLNHHQTPFCDELYKLLGNDFIFVSTEKIPLEFLQGGYEDCTNYEYNLNAYVDDEHNQKAKKLGLESDVVIVGAAPNVFIKERLKKNKLTFRISERLLKKGWQYLFHPRVLKSLLLNHAQYRKKNIYMLCASAYTANDLDKVFAYPEKKYKWGYFTQVKRLNIEKIIANKQSDCIYILWTARFIEWKHPELAIELAYELKKRGHNFHLNMIGIGKMLEFIRQLIKQLDVEDCVTLLGSMPNKEVVEYMTSSNIFLFTSDRNEGWGAVLNEAMGCGCAVVASDLIGAVPYLIEHKKNGLIFETDNFPSLLQQTESLLKDPAFMNVLGKNAYHTLVNEWSPHQAATNFILLAKSKLNGQEISIEEGPCSQAKP
jgi:glycosyltransferase involved in cell wall biosynthesis